MEATTANKKQSRIRVPKGATFVRTDGMYAGSLRTAPWQDIAKTVEGTHTAAEAIKAAGLDWKVVKTPIFVKGADGSDIVIPKRKALVRDTDNHVLSVMKDAYTPLQNSDAFNFFNPFVESGLASFEAAGQLKDGQVIWVLANLNKAPLDVGGGDIINKHLLLSNGHNGNMATRVCFKSVRQVCTNGLTASKIDSIIRLHHSANIKTNLEALQQTINAIDAKFEATAEQYKALTKKAINKKDLEKYINIVFELNPKGNERDISRAKKMQETIVKLFETGAGSDLKSAKNTWWGAYNAVTEYLTHESGGNGEKSQSTRLFNNWFGNLAQKNEQALEVALEAL
jgi:phage/plasmid-like protein (TIGR03299 family)